MKQAKPQLAIDFRDVQIDDLMQNPHKFGCPTFEEFARTRDKWVGRPDEGMIVLTDGPKAFRNDLNDIKFQIRGHEVKEDHVERALGDYGYTLEDIDLENRNSRLKKEIQMIPLGGGKFDVVVNFLP